MYQNKTNNTNVQFSCSVMSNSLQPHELQHARPPCTSPTRRVHLNSCPLSQWCHPAISSSFAPFSSCPQSLRASESLTMSQLFAWGGQSTGVSVLASFLPRNTQGWSPLEWTGWISLQSKGFSRVFSNTEAPIIWPPDVKNWFIGKDPDAGKVWRQEEKGMTEDEMVGWHHRLNGREFGWAPGVGDGQGGLACCSSWGCKELDSTEQLNWTDKR